MLNISCNVYNRRAVSRLTTSRSQSSDFLISVCATYLSLNWKKEGKEKIKKGKEKKKKKKKERRKWLALFIQEKNSKLCMQKWLTINHPPCSSRQSIGCSQISVPKFCLKNHSSNTNMKSQQENTPSPWCEYKQTFPNLPASA